MTPVLSALMQGKRKCAMFSSLTWYGVTSLLSSPEPAAGSSVGAFTDPALCRMREGGGSRDVTGRGAESPLRSPDYLAPAAPLH